MSFLPSGYEPPKNDSKYLKFEKGKTKFRILSSAIVGWEWWIENPDKPGKRFPARCRKVNEIPEEVRSAVEKEDKAKHFWAFAVWDYKSASIKLCQLTQSTIMGVIREHAEAEEDGWGDPKGYDITVTATGDKLEREYTTVCSVPKPFDPSIAEEAKGINLEALFDNEDPFAAPKGGWTSKPGFQPPDETETEQAQLEDDAEVMAEAPKRRGRHAG